MYNFRTGKPVRSFKDPRLVQKANIIAPITRISSTITLPGKHKLVATLIREEHAYSEPISRFNIFFLTCFATEG